MLGEVPNYLYYSFDYLPVGNHTLIVNITAAENQSFVLDYITYGPSFETLSSMPLLDNTTSITTSATIWSSTSSPQPSQAQTSGTRPSRIAIVGGVIAALTLVLIAILGRWLFVRRRKAKEIVEVSQYVQEYQPGSGMLRIPLFTHEPSSEFFLNYRCKQRTYTNS
jgi:hypothetical protein